MPLQHGDSATPQTRAVIGLELHAQLAAPVKLFSGARADYFGQPPNSLVHAFDIAVPGTLPVLQRAPVRLAIRAAAALGFGAIALRSSFDRKHYTHPDLPHGYQITQQEVPLARHGNISICPVFGAREQRNIRLSRLHIEQDTASVQRATREMDYNRAGVALIEIVTEPEIDYPEDAAAAVSAIQFLLRQAGVSRASIEEGSLRIDANVNLISDTFCTPTVELKNVALKSGLKNAIDIEISRQRDALARGIALRRESRSVSQITGISTPMRAKMSHDDYMYCRDPNIPCLIVSSEEIENERAALRDVHLANCSGNSESQLDLLQPLMQRLRTAMRLHGKVQGGEAPAEELNRLRKLISMTGAVSYFIRVLDSPEARGVPGAAVFNFMTSVLARRCASNFINCETTLVSAERLAELLRLRICDRIISSKTSEILVDHIAQNPTQSVFDIARAQDMFIISDVEILRPIVERVCDEAVKGEKGTTKKYLLEQALAETRYRTEPAIIVTIIDQVLVKMTRGR